MRPREELVERLAGKRSERLGTLSSGAFDELVLAVRAAPERFVDDADDQAFFQVVQALERHDRAREAEEVLDDDAFFAARSARMERLASDCRAALSVDGGCLDAALLCVLAMDAEPTRTLSALLELEQEVAAADAPHAASAVRTAAAARARLRLRSAIARAYLDCSHYALARDTALEILAMAPDDPTGARHTAALALARLEDEAGFDALDARFGRAGSAWDHLGRTILLYKLDRLAAARRALAGYVRLCEGGAYALLMPTVVDTYLPDRFEVPTASFEEATLAVWEAEPILADVPYLVSWAADQPQVLARAEAFARHNDLDW